MAQKLLLSVLVLCGTLSAQITSIENGASFRPAISAGSWATLKGTFAGVTQTIGVIPVGTNLAGVTVTVAGVAAPVYFVSTGQINFIVPAGTAAGLQPIQVKAGSATYDSTIRIISAAPGIFFQDTATPPKGAVLNQNSTLNTSTNVALRGEFVQIYATGPGTFKNAITDGAGAPGNPLNTTLSTPQVYIGGVLTEVQFTGLAPGFPALWQVNAKVPSQTFITGRVPVVITMDGVDSNEVTIFVQ
ncbi:MAG: IPT/TIG domain-containing protein [Acidobacteriota bacterium]